MNRPKQEDYFEDTMMAKFTRFDYDSYTDAIEEYCDELEKALDKACNGLWWAEGMLYKAHSKTKEEWKEWCSRSE